MSSLLLFYLRLESDTHQSRWIFHYLFGWNTTPSPESSALFGSYSSSDKRSERRSERFNRWRKENNSTKVDCIIIPWSFPLNCLYLIVGKMQRLKNVWCVSVFNQWINKKKICHHSTWINFFLLLLLLLFVSYLCCNRWN